MSQNNEKKTFSGAIGIDLGTTFSCVSVFLNGKVETIANDSGDRTTPSYVAYANGERLIGKAAKNQADYNPKNTIYDSKRLIGRNFNDEDVQRDIKMYPFEVINKNNKPYFKVEHMNKEKLLTPEEVSAAVLYKMKDVAEKYIGEKVVNAVVTVPAYFNDVQRNATKDAGTIAGLNILRIINEPTSAAIAYGFGNSSSDDKNILVFDLGGGTFDVSVLNVDDGAFEVLATSGDTHLGGEDFDNKIVQHIITDFKRINKVDISNNMKAIRKIKTKAEHIKIQLSSANETQVLIESLYNGIDYNSKLSRAKFEMLCKPLFEKTLESVEKVLTDSKKDKGDIDEVILVGGSTRIPKIRTMLSEYFNGKKLNNTVNPDEAVSFGAAIQGSKLTGSKDEAIKSIILIDVTPLSLGIAVGQNTLSKIIKRNTKIPAFGTETYTTSSNGQAKALIRICEGERSRFDLNHELGSFEVDFQKALNRNEAMIEVKFEVDTDGILNVGVVEQSTGVTKSLVIDQAGKLSKDEIYKMVDEAEKNKEEDEEYRQKSEAKSKFENYVFDLREEMEKAKDLSEDEKTTLVEIIDEADNWFNSIDYNVTSSDINEKMEEIKRKIPEDISKKLSSSPSAMPNMQMPDGMPPNMQMPEGFDKEKFAEQMKEGFDKEKFAEQMSKMQTSQPDEPATEQPVIPDID